MLAPFLSNQVVRCCLENAASVAWTFLPTLWLLTSRSRSLWLLETQWIIQVYLNLSYSSMSSEGVEIPAKKKELLRNPEKTTRTKNRERVNEREKRNAHNESSIIFWFFLIQTINTTNTAYYRNALWYINIYTYNLPLKLDLQFHLLLSLLIAESINSIKVHNFCQ